MVYCCSMSGEDVSVHLTHLGFLFLSLLFTPMYLVCGSIYNFRIIRGVLLFEYVLDLLQLQSHIRTVIYN